MNIPADLVETWFEDVLNTRLRFQQPLLTANSTSCLKAICDALILTGHVFVMSVTVLEDYLRLKDSANKKIENHVAMVVAVISICAKFVGEGEETIELNAAHFQQVLKKYCKRGDIDKRIVKLSEIDILRTFEGKLPIANKFDDLHLFLEVLCKPLKLKVCIHI